MVAFKKYAKNAKKFVKKRYTTKRGSTNVKKLASDVFKIQRALNVEHKHINYQLGTSGNIGLQIPTKSNPLIIAINTPDRGTGYNNRVGNQIKVTHLTAKYQFTFHNNTDLIQRQNVRARIIFARNASDVPVISQLLEPDANGHYTPMSFTNTQQYKKFVWMKSLDTRCSYTQPTNRYPPSSGSAEYTNPQPDTDAKENATDIAPASLNIANFFKNAKSTCNIRMMFRNSSDEVEMMKPYLMLTSDIIDAPSALQSPYDYVSVSANLRMTYVDN